MKLLIFLPLFLFSYYYPLNYQFVFMRKCMQNSSLANKYQYCECVFNKIKDTYSYDYFIWHSTDLQVLNSLKKFSKECLKLIKK